MAIYGGVGYRANKIRMINGELIVTSPMYSGFKWPQPVMWAKCSSCPTDEDGHVISDIECDCGIYSTTSLDVLRYYVDGDNFVPILVECLGNYWFHIDDDDPTIKGYTAAGVQVAAVIGDYVNRNVETPQMWIAALASFYDVPVLTLEEGNALIEWAWDTFYPKEKEEMDEHYEEVPAAWLR